MAAAAGLGAAEQYPNYNDYNLTDPGNDVFIPAAVPLQPAPGGVGGPGAQAVVAGPVAAGAHPAADPRVQNIWNSIFSRIAAVPQTIGGWFSLPSAVAAPAEQQIKLPELESNQECLFEFEKANSARLALINNLDLLFKALKTAKLTAGLIETPDGTQKFLQKFNSIFKVDPQDRETGKKILIARFKQSLQYRKMAMDCSEKLHHGSLPLAKPDPSPEETKQIRADQDKAHNELIKACNSSDEKQKELILSFKTFLKIEPKDLKLDAPPAEIKMTPILAFIQKHPTITIGTAFGAAAFFHPELYSFGGSVISTITAYRPELLDYLQCHPDYISYGVPAAVVAFSALLDKPTEALKDAWESTAKTLKNFAHAYFSASPLLGAVEAGAVLGGIKAGVAWGVFKAGGRVESYAPSLITPLLYAHAALFVGSTIYDNQAALRNSYNSLLHTSANKILNITREFFRKGYLTGLATGAVAGALSDSLRIGVGVYLAQLIFSGAILITDRHEKAKLI